MQPLHLQRVNVGILVRRSVSEISNRQRGLACPRCKGGMREVVRIRAGASGRRGPSWKRCPRIRAAGEKKPRRSGAEVRICRVPRVISGTSNHTRLPKQLRLLHCRSRAPHTPLSLRAPDSAPSLGRADKPVSSRTINEEVESVMAC